tara:strand:- start:37 stop:276 length:240 start_codon:yes stop_codon:yes gene_type:complete
MAKQTKVRYVISPDGKTITEQVEGIKGNQCQVITNPIETALGELINKAYTSDFYDTEDRMQQLEEEDWVGTCTSWRCAL